GQTDDRGRKVNPPMSVLRRPSSVVVKKQNPGRSRGLPITWLHREERDDVLRTVIPLYFSWSMIFSDLPSPAEASSQMTDRATGSAQAETRHPPRIKCGAGFFGIMLYRCGFCPP